MSDKEEIKKLNSQRDRLRVKIKKIISKGDILGEAKLKRIYTHTHPRLLWHNHIFPHFHSVYHLL